MSTTASDSFATTLLVACQAANLVFVGNDLADLYLSKEDHRDGFFDVGDATGIRYEFKDQDIAVNDGLSRFEDIDGEGQVIHFVMTRPMVLLDVVAARLKT